MNLHDLVLRLLQEHNEYGYNGILQSMPLSICKAIDSAPPEDDFCSKSSSEIISLLQSFQGGYTEHLKTAYDVFIECSIYLEMKEKGLKVDRVPEQKTSTPDFNISLEGEAAYFEVKALGWSRGSENYNSVIDSGISAQIDIQDQLSVGKKIAFGESEIAPFGSDWTSFKCPPKHFIETVIDKCIQNLKPSQFALGPTFLVCDLTSYHHPTSPEESAVHSFKESLYGSTCSGELWHITFGKLGTPILKAIEFEGKPNICGYLDKNGVLNEADYVKGIIFRTSTLNGRISYTCLASEPVYDEFGHLLTAMGDFCNDEKNTFAFKVSKAES